MISDSTGSTTETENVSSSSYLTFSSSKEHLSFSELNSIESTEST